MKSVIAVYYSDKTRHGNAICNGPLHPLGTKTALTEAILSGLAAKDGPLHPLGQTQLLHDERHGRLNSFERLGR